MNTTIIGPGAVGTLVGGMLRLAGHDITFVGKSGAGARKKAAGSPAGQRGGISSPRVGSLRVIHPSGWNVAEGVTYAGPENAALDSDAWIVTLARHHLRSVRRPDFARLTGDTEAPVFFFNCDPAEPERLAVAPERRRYGLTLLNAVKLQEGDAELASADPALVVEKGPRTDELFQGLRSFGFRVHTVDDALPFMRSFFIFQLLYLPVALCNMTLAAFLSNPHGRELALNILNEGFLTAEKLGQSLAPLPAMDPRELAARIQKKPASFSAALEEPDRSYNTILQAYLADRAIEAAHFNRRLVEMASSAGVHLTWNWRVMQKAGRVSSVGFYRDPAELLKSLE